MLRDQFVCQYCKKNNGKLEAHHILPKRDGGKDTILNLVTLCSTHHKALHKGKIKLKAEGVGNLKDVVAQRTMQGKNHLYKSLAIFGEVTKMFGSIDNAIGSTKTSFSLI
ncbi:MAG: HNH endonuclease [Desulfobacterium sp.]